MISTVRRHPVFFFLVACLALLLLFALAGPELTATQGHNAVAPVSANPAVSSSPTPTSTPTPIARFYLPIILRLYVHSQRHLPDLTIKAMRIELETGGACDYTSTQLGVRVQFQNIGRADAGPFVVEANGEGRTVASGLGSGQADTIWIPRYVYLGVNTAIVDATFQVIESNEDNNQLSGYLPIPTLPPTCTPTPTATATPTRSN